MYISYTLLNLFDNKALLPLQVLIARYIYIGIIIEPKELYGHIKCSNRRKPKCTKDTEISTTICIFQSTSVRLNASYSMFIFFDSGAVCLGTRMDKIQFFKVALIIS